jgi:soluble lytic murein transglycosylase-like protein
MVSSNIPSYVPAEYDQWVTDAAAGTGLPVTVVAAQINEESGFNPDVTSPAGAEGIAQFEPATYADVGGKGSEYVAQNELQPYINLTNENLQWSGGDVEKALAAYNAGQGNWQAGLGYADTILANAGETRNATATPGDKNVSGAAPGPGISGFNPANPFSWGDLFNADTLERFGLIVLGGLLVIVGIWMLAGKQTLKVVTQTAKTAVESGAV